VTLRDEPWAGRLDELEPQGTEMAERLAGDDTAMLEALEREAADSPNPPNRETSGNMQDGGTSGERTMGTDKKPEAR